MSKAHYKIEERTLDGQPFFIVCYPGGLAISGRYNTYAEADAFAKKWVREMLRNG